MPRYLIHILFLLFTLNAYSLNVSIKTLFTSGKPTYAVQIEPFAQEPDAKTYQQKLPPEVASKAQVSRIADSLQYKVQIGPYVSYQEAKQLKGNLSDSENPEAQSASKKNTDDSEPVTQIGSDSSSQPIAAPNSKTVWNLNNAEIRTVAAEVSKITGKNFLIDPRVQGKISIVSNTPISEKALYQVFLSMLQISGYAAIPNGEVIKIVPNVDARTFSSDGLDSLQHPPKGDAMMVTVVPVHYVSADQLVPVLRPLMPQWSQISAYNPSNMLILSGRANNIRTIADIIKQVDTASANDIDIIPLHHALAMDIANTLKELIKSNTTTDNRQHTTLAVDDKNNTILIGGNKTERLRLRLLIAKLDHQSSSSNQSNTKVIYLNYLRAEDAVPLLAGIAQANFSGTVGTTIGTITRPVLDSTNPASSIASEPAGSSTPPSAMQDNNNIKPSNSQTEGSNKPNVQLIAEPNTNSIIINAPASLIRLLQNVVAQLDIRPAQLLIEAMVAEIDESDINNLGIEWGSNEQSGKSSSFRPGFAIINSKTSINDFQAQLYALQREHKANILSTPSVVVLDNRQAKILVGKQVSVASTNYPGNANGTTTASPYTTFNRVNVALHLYVRPQITRARGIQLQIDQGNDTIDPSTGNLSTNDNPVFKISSIVTSVHVESGDVVVLGGLAQDSLGNDNNGIPILKDIPGIGRIFQRNLRNREKRVLMVFIRPIILRDERSAVRLTGEKYNDIRENQLDWVRNQESFQQDDQQTVLPALNNKRLPAPFPVKNIDDMPTR